MSTASHRTVVSMTLAIDGQVRAHYQGYFQSSLHVSPAYHEGGFQVRCGPAGVDGVSGMGHVYLWKLLARDSERLDAINEGAVTCPALDPIHVFVPLTRRE